jgi:tripartite-type tricarboxylate transporter receptor subunit TctC
MPASNRSEKDPDMRGLLAAIGLCAAASLAQAQTDAYPSRPVTIVIAFGPGSASDTIARIIGQPLGIALKQSIVVEAKPGANATIAASYVARAAPDGYTILIGTNTSH